MANARHVLLVLGLCAPNTLRAQGASSSVGQRDSAARVVDSLLARLARAEDAIELLRRQLVTEAGSAVKTRSRLQLELSGRVQTNAFTSNARMNNTELPFFVRETDAPASGGRNGAAGARGAPRESDRSHAVRCGYTDGVLCQKVHTIIFG